MGKELISFICARCGKYNNISDNKTTDCVHCEGYMPSKNVSTTYFDTSLGEYVNSKDIDRICKEKGMVYGHIDDMDKQAKSNKDYKRGTINKEMSRELSEDIRRAIG